MRKLLSVILALAMVLSVFAPVFAEEEAPKTEEAAAPALEKHIEFLKEQGIIKGDKNGDLMLEKNIERSEFAAILVRADGKETVAESVKTLPGRFTDMDANHWGNGYATVAHDNGWMKGYPSGEFMPGKNITYAEIATTLVRFLGKEKVGFVYPTSYIAAATELGLFAGMEAEIGGEYVANATRDHVFHMLYNALSMEDFGRYNVYKTIVLENDRVAELKENEIKAEVLSVVQIANNVDERNRTNKKVGEQFVLNVKDVKVEGGLADTENLIGKVVNITLDENNKLVKIVVDNDNYEYYWGKFAASKDGKTFEIDDRKFNVRFDERYYGNKDETDNRVYRTYVTEDKRAENLHYSDFVRRKALRKADKEYIDANLARITVRDGMVIFVDAFRLEDIAPIKEVAREGSKKDVYFWNDKNNARVDRTVVEGRVIGFTEKDGFKIIKPEDIKAGDTIHWLKGLTIVRQDALLEAELVKTYINKDGEFGILKGKEDKTEDYFLNSKNDEKSEFHSVYAYDDNHYRTLVTRLDLNKMIDSKVKVLLDVFGNIQLITSDKVFTDRLGLVLRTGNRGGMLFALPNNPEEKTYVLYDDLDTKTSYYDHTGKWNSGRELGANAFHTFKLLDLVYTSEKENNVADIIAAVKDFDYESYSQRFAKAVFNKRRESITVGVDKVYRYTDDTEVFVLNKDMDNVKSGITLADVKKYNVDNDELEAVVLTEKEYADFLNKDIKVNTWGRYHDASDKFAKVIIFKNYEGPSAELHARQFGQVVDVINTYSKTIVSIRLENERVIKLEVNDADKEVKFDRALIGKYIEFNRIKEEVKEGAFERANFEKPIVFTIKGKIKSNSNRRIQLQGHKEYIVDGATSEFGHSRDGYAMIYSSENDDYADLIVYTKEDTGSDVPVEYYLFQYALDKVDLKAITAQNVLDVKAAYEALEGKNGLSNMTLAEERKYEVIMASTAAKLQDAYEKAAKAIKEFKPAVVGKLTSAEMEKVEALIEEYNKFKDKAVKDDTAETKAGELEALLKKATNQKILDDYKSGKVITAEQNVKDAKDALTDPQKADQTVIDKMSNLDEALNNLKAEKILADEKDATLTNAKEEIDNLGKAVTNAITALQNAAAAVQ